MIAQARLLVGLAVRGQRRATFWWGLGIAVLTVVSMAFWPSLEGTDTLVDLTRSSKELMEAFGAENLSTGPGYLDGQLFALMLPALLAGFCIAVVSASTAGDEEAGRLELLHALPVERRVVWLTRLVAASLVLIVVTALTVLVTLVSLRPFSFDDVKIGSVLAASLGCLALAGFNGTVTYTVAAAGRGRGASAGLAVAVLVASYTANSLLPLSDRLRWARQISPWYWALGTQPVSDGVSPWRLCLLLVVTCGLATVGTLLIERRDLRGA